MDTSVVSALIGKRSIEPAIRRFFDAFDEHRMYLSVITVGEMVKGIDLIPWPSDPMALTQRGVVQTQWERRLEALCARFDGRIVDIDFALAREWGRLQAAAQRMGKPASVYDTLIVASAISKGLVVVTIDKDFSAFGNLVAVYNPRTHAGA